MGAALYQPRVPGAWINNVCKPSKGGHTYQSGPLTATSRPLYPTSVVATTLETQKGKGVSKWRFTRNTGLTLEALLLMPSSVGTLLEAKSPKAEPMWLQPTDPWSAASKRQLPWFSGNDDDEKVLWCATSSDLDDINSEIVEYAVFHSFEATAADVQ